jgi:hypothetical protein
MALNSAIKVQSGIECRAEESALAEHALVVFRILKGRQTLGVGKGLEPVMLIRRQAGEAEHRQADIIGTFGWQKVTVMRTAKLCHQGNSKLAVILEFLELTRVEHIANMAGDHAGPSMIGMACCSGEGCQARSTYRLYFYRAGTRRTSTGK